MSYDLAIKVGEYEKDGETKGRYVRLGALLKGDNGMYMLIDPTVDLAGCMIKQRVMNPQKAGDAVMVSVFDRNKDKSSGSGNGGSAGGGNDFDNDIPF